MFNVFSMIESLPKFSEGFKGKLKPTFQESLERDRDEQYADLQHTAETVRRGRELTDEQKAASDRLARKAYRVWRLCRNRSKVLGK